MTPRTSATAAFSLAILLATGAARAAEPVRDPIREKVRAWRAAHEREIVGELSDLLALPNVATRVADIERNADRLTEMLQRRGFEVRRLSAGPGTPPALLGDLRVPGAKRTIVFYAHYDGQPVGQKGWLSDPFKPVTAHEVLAALSQLKRRGVWPLLQDMEHNEPELAYHLLEELSLVHKTLLDSAAPPKVVRRLQHQVQSLILVCVVALRPSAAGDGAGRPAQDDACDG